MRRVGEAIKEHSEYIIYNKGEMGGQRGVGFMVKIHLKNYIQDFLRVTDGISTLNMKIPNYKKRWTVIQVYAPTEQANKSEHELFYSKLSQTIITHSNNTIILIVDFNAQEPNKMKMNMCWANLVMGKGVRMEKDW
ncbi:hypothetical protein EVAR_11775_1 [Eumeta japonica]|uniref:Craniofacial development protein 2 n=1 Tax=Eumeta variegata TaxID=151549 RepID=A0A4C1UPF8_EUMVA|nr:hypothetical protein EVAR_11775_1 [Eumeta japonica]